MKVVRASELPVDPSDQGVAALRLVNSKQGAQTMTAGVATFEPGARILLHNHPCEETVIILEGQGTAHIGGKTFELTKYDTTIVEAGLPHYFANNSSEPMTIAYFYPVLDAERHAVAE